MNAVEIEEAVTELADQPFDAAEFPYLFLEAFGNPASTIKRLRSGTTNRSDLGGVLQTNNIHIVTCPEGAATGDPPAHNSECPRLEDHEARPVASGMTRVIS